MVNKRGQVAGEEISIWWGIVYGILTISVALAVVLVPIALMGSAVQPVGIDQTGQAQQIKSQLWVTDPNTGRTDPFEYKSSLKGINETISRKQITYRVGLDANEIIFNEKFYKISKPIAKFKYNTYVEGRYVMVGGKKQTLFIEEIYPKKYVATT